MKKLNWNTYICIAISITAFAFILYRIFHAAFTMDEWGMMTFSIQPGLESLITFRHQDPQSHFLQGLFAIPFFKILPFPPAESARLPSLLMFPIFALACFQLTKRVSNKFLQILFFTSMMCPQIILEYFGMARGYAFLLAFGTASIAALVESYNQEHTELIQERWARASIGFAALAMLALLTFAYGYLIIACLLLFKYYLKETGTTWQKIINTLKNGSFVIWTSLVLAVFFLPRYLIMNQFTSMHWGGMSGFIADTFTSLLECVGYIALDCHHTVHNLAIPQWIVYGLFVLVLFNLIVFVITALKNKIEIRTLIKSPFFLSSMIFFGIAISMQLLFWILSMQFPTRRTVLYIWPIMILCLGFFVNEYKSTILRIINVLAMIASIGYCCTTYNTYMANESKWDCDTREITNVICELAKDFKTRPMFLASTDNMRAIMWYYLEFEHDMPQVPAFRNHPIFKMFGNNDIFIYSTSYGYPQPYPPIWHHFPFPPDYYLLSPWEPGQAPNPNLMDTNPIYTFPRSKAAIFKAREDVNGNDLGCNVEQCLICQAMYNLVRKPDNE